MAETRKLKRIEVDEVSLAQNPANRRSFILLKDMLENNPKAEEILKALHHHLDAINEIIGGDEETLKLLTTVASFVEDQDLPTEYAISSMNNIVTNLALLRDYIRKLQKEMQYSIDFQKENWRVGGDRDLPLRDDDSWDADAAVESVRRWAMDGDKIDFGKYKRAFIIYDADAPENLTSYKFPFARVVDGRLYASRAGLITAKRAAAGARTGRRHPLADRIIAFVNSYLGEDEENKDVEKENVGMSEQVNEKKMQETPLELEKEYEALRKELEALRLRAETAEAMAKEEREKRLAKEWEDRAENYKVFGVDKSTLAKMMRTLDESGIEWKPVFDAIAEKLKTSELYREVGFSATPANAFEDILTQELQKETNKDKSIYEVVRELARSNPELYEQYRRKFTS